MKKITFLFLSLFTSYLWAQSPNWSDDVASILYLNCTACHHQGGLAPFSLMTYNDAYGFSSDIATAVTDKSMPPWPPDHDYKALAHERLLSPAEIATIQTWVQNGAPEGNSQNAPPQPTYTNQPTILTPDLTVTIPSYTSTAATGDVYRCFVIPSNIAAEKYITDVEVIPGNPAIVHHVLIYSDTTNVPVNLDNQDPDAGYAGFGGTGSDESKLIGTWVPGSLPVSYPTNMGIRLPANANIILQIHYPTGSDGQQDNTSVRFKLTNSASRPLYIAPVLNHSTNLINGPLYLPPNTTSTFVEEYTTPPINISILNVGPHMHLIGKKIKVYGVATTGDTLPYIKIDNWDFHWQGGYMFKNIEKVPASTKLRAEAFYDNTANNPDNPNSPPQAVSLGESTTDEMMLVYFTYTIYFPGDENIVLETNTTALENEQNHISFQCYPNPSKDKLQIQLPQNLTAPAVLRIIDAKGMIVREMDIESNKDIPASDLAAGTYMLWIKAGDKYGLEKWIKH